MIKEFWKNIENYPGYQVSNYGRVRSLGNDKYRKEKVLKPSENGGYIQVVLYKNGKSKTYKIHRLVATAFIPNPNNLPEVNHKDENKENNFIYINPDGTVNLEKSNLEWCNRSYNNSYGSHNQRISETQKNRPDKSKRVAQYTLDGTLVAIYPSIMEASRQTGFDFRCISSCCLGKRKTHKGYIWKFIE